MIINVLSWLLSGLLTLTAATCKKNELSSLRCFHSATLVSGRDHMTGLTGNIMVQDVNN